ncbi:hypothetical protein T08_1592, partial [Trichinella sp. T8]
MSYFGRWSLAKAAANNSLPVVLDLMGIFIFVMPEHFKYNLYVIYTLQENFGNIKESSNRPIESLLGRQYSPPKLHISSNGGDLYATETM